MAKENVRKRLEREGNGISFQEFSYGLLQGYDFVHLYQNYGCTLQIAGTDNLGNMVTGQDLVHKMLGKDDVCGLTWDLITCADGRKFGKTEGNSVWLDPKKTSPYQFMQYWLNVSDVDAEVFIKKFTLTPLDEIEKMIERHRENPAARILQKELARYMTCLVHSEEEYNKAVKATDILFGKGTTEQLATIDEDSLLAAMDGVAKVEVDKEQFTSGVSVVDLAAMHDKVPSKTEARKLIKSNGFSINKVKPDSEKDVVKAPYLINGKYLLLQKGRKDYTLVIAK
jgi:tyrosyl-tRNA synthetase